MNKQLKRPEVIFIGVGILLVINVVLLLLFFNRNLDFKGTSFLTTQVSERSSPSDKREDHRDKIVDIKSLMDACIDAGGADNCYQQVANNLHASFSLADSLELLSDNESYPSVYARCHQVTHLLGREAYKESQNLPATLTSCDSTCEGGCYHGAVEEYLKEHDHNFSGDTLRNTFTSICKEGSLTPLIFGECQHGLGHAAMFVSNNALSPSLTLCDTLPAVPGRERCYSGVFMEYSSSSTSTSVAGKTLHPSDPLYPCNILSTQYLKLCYEYQSSYFSIITHYDAKATADLCLEVPSEYREGCIQVIGGGQVGLTSDTKTMSHNCSLMPNSEYRNICNNGVISSLATRFVGKIDKLTNFCNEVSKEDQEGCFAQIGIVVTSWEANSKTREKYCMQIKDKTYASWCLNSDPNH